MKRIEAIAYHEAGHAVCSLALNRAFKYVTIVRDGNTLGHCQGLVYRGGQRLETDVYEGNGRGRDWIEKQVKICLAGNVAERIYAGRNVVTGSNADFTNAMDLLEHLCGSVEESGAYFDLLFVRTCNRITAPSNWMKVERLVAELLDKQTVRYKDAKKLADQSLEDFRRLPREEISRMFEEAEMRRQRLAKKGAK